jgi:hypothetical protein
MNNVLIYFNFNYRVHVSLSRALQTLHETYMIYIHVYIMLPYIGVIMP